MNKKAVRAGVACGIILGATVITYGITSLFFAKSVTSKFVKQTVFRFDLSTDMNSGEVGPGDSFEVRPVIYNDATESMYVFIQVDMPIVEYEALYLFDVADEWCVVSEDGGTVVYAYGNTEMKILTPGESTTALTSQMTMKSISNAEYADIDDINIRITGYAMGTEDMSTNPVDAWNECKTIGNIQ